MEANEPLAESVRALVADLQERSLPKLPPERELAVRFSTTRSAVRRAVDALVAEGTLYRVMGRAGGAFISGMDATAPPTGQVLNYGTRKVLRDPAIPVPVPDLVESQGFRYGTRVLEAVRARPSRKVADFLAVDADTESVLRMRRIRYLDGDPLSLELLYCAAERFSGLLQLDLQASIYGHMSERFGVEVGRVVEEIEIAAAADTTAKALEIPVGQPVLRIRRKCWDSQGTPLECSRDIFRADRTCLRIDSHRTNFTALLQHAPTARNG
jgi:GntR family transcriptional regulator